MTAAQDGDTEAPLRVTIVQRGGFAGVRSIHEADTASLAPGPARTLRALVEASGLLTGTPDIVARRFPLGRDLLEWEITATRGRTSRGARCTEDALGPALTALIAFVRGTA